MACLFVRSMPALHAWRRRRKAGRAGREGNGMDKPRQGAAGLWNISFGFLGIQIGFALQIANCEYEPRLPVARFRHPGLLMQPVTGHMSDRTWIGRLVRRRPYFLLGAPACRPARWALYGAVQHPRPGAAIAGRDGDGIDHEGFLSRRTDQDHGLCSGTLILAAIASIRVRMWQLRRAI